MSTLAGFDDIVIDEGLENELRCAIPHELRQRIVDAGLWPSFEIELAPQLAILRSQEGIGVDAEMPEFELPSAEDEGLPSTYFVQRHPQTHELIVRAFEEFDFSEDSEDEFVDPNNN